MPRPPRILAAECTYHVTTRGNDRQTLFYRDSERQAFLSDLDGIVRHRKWRLGGYCLLDNHVHLLLETPEPDLDQGMRDLLSRWAWRFNRAHRRTGHVFGGRYFSKVVTDDRHLQTTVRYIARNPVAAGLVSSPYDWPWNSCIALVEGASSKVDLDCSHLLDMLHPNMTRARAILRYLIEEDDVPAGTGRPGVPSVSALVQVFGPQHGARAAVRFGYSQREIGEVLGLDRSTISRWMSSLRGI